MAFSWPFFNLEENNIFLGLFWLNSTKHPTFYDISKFIWYILVHFLGKFGLYLAFFTIWEFGLFLNCLRPNLAFFYFLGPGNPGVGGLCTAPRVRAPDWGHQWGRSNMWVVDYLLVSSGLCKDPNYVRLIELCFTHPDLCKLGVWGWFYEREHRWH